MSEAGTVLSVINNIERQAFQLGFQISPIILNNGIAGNTTGAMLPIVALTEAAAFGAALASGNITDSLDTFFSQWRPLPGGTMIDFQVAEYPFANQSVAANAIIAQPLRISMEMTAMVRTAGGYIAKFITLSALQSILQQHALLGGTYTVATPALFYPNSLLTRVVDQSNAQSKQAQNTWVFEFVQPLVTQQQAQAAQSALMSRITNGTPINGQPTTTGAAIATGSPVSAPGSGSGAANLAGTNVGGTQSIVEAGFSSGSVA